MKQIFSRRKRARSIISFVIANIVLAFVVSLIFIDGSAENLGDFLISMIWSFVICMTQWLGHSYIYSRLEKKYPWEKQLVKRAIFNSLAIIVYAVFAYLALILLMVRFTYGGFPENLLSWALKSSFSAILISFAVIIIVVTIGFFRKWKMSLLEAERLKGEMLRYKYESLQNQINPHFLFNSFNVLSDLVYEDQKKAVTFIKQLSELFRYVLDSRDKELVSIGEELEFITSFAFLLHTRFEDKLSIRIEIESESDEMVVPMTMQLLIENCVKHNEVSATNPLKISVTRKNGYIEVVNNLQLKPVGDDSKDTGLSNIVQQYSFFTNKPIVIDKTEQHYSVKVPILKSANK